MHALFALLASHGQIERHTGHRSVQPSFLNAPKFKFSYNSSKERTANPFPPMIRVNINCTDFSAFLLVFPKSCYLAGYHGHK